MGNLELAIRELVRGSIGKQTTTNRTVDRHIPLPHSFINPLIAVEQEEKI